MSSINNLSVQQLRHAADLKEKIEGLQKELSQLTGSTVTTAVPVTVKAPKKGMSAAGRAKVAAAQKARWAKINAAKKAAQSATPAKAAIKTTTPVKTAKKKSGMDAAAKAKLSIAMKAAWAARKAAKK